MQKKKLDGILKQTNRRNLYCSCSLNNIIVGFVGFVLNSDYGKVKYIPININEPFCLFVNFKIFYFLTWCVFTYMYNITGYYTRLLYILHKTIKLTMLISTGSIDHIHRKQLLDLYLYSFVFLKTSPYLSSLISLRLSFVLFPNSKKFYV